MSELNIFLFFKFYVRFWGPMCITVPISSKLVEQLQRYAVAPPGFCNRGEVKYGSIGGLEYEVPQSRLYCLYQRGSLLDGRAMYLSCDTKKFHDNESTHILYNFWTSTRRGKLSPLGDATGDMVI